jgi:hypothetical protein
VPAPTEAERVAGRVIPEPTVVLLGCQPWPPRPRPDGSCPVCGGSIAAKHRYYCGWDDRLNPATEARLRAARLGLKVQAEIDRQKGRLDELTRRKQGGRATLSEIERRRLWNGYRGSLLTADPEPTNRAAIGRAFLTAIGQEPNFALILDRRGRVVAGPHPHETKESS